MSMMRVVVILSLCAAFLVVDVQAAVPECTLTDVAACWNAVSKGDKPTLQCCQELAAVDVACFCKKLDEQKGKYPPAYIAHALAVPAGCGGLAYDHFKGKTCAGETIG